MLRLLRRLARTSETINRIRGLSKSLDIAERLYRDIRGDQVGDFVLCCGGKTLHATGTDSTVRRVASGLAQATGTCVTMVRVIERFHCASCRSTSHPSN